jgi:putative acyl-CoA dehydrogenase
MATSEHERLLARVATPVMKFWNCQRAPAFSYECLQVHGGNGFIMENPMARLYREAPLNSIWEGTSNMMCMDVLRAMQRDARCRDAFIDELRASRGLNRTYDISTESLVDRLRAHYPDDGHARALVTRMAHALQASEMLQHGDAEAADLFVKSRLGMDGMHVFGALPASDGLAGIVARAAVIRH